MKHIEHPLIIEKKQFCNCSKNRCLSAIVCSVIENTTNKNNYFFSILASVNFGINKIILSGKL